MPGEFLQIFFTRKINRDSTYKYLHNDSLQPPLMVIIKLTTLSFTCFIVKRCFVKADEAYDYDPLIQTRSYREYNF